MGFLQWSRWAVQLWLPVPWSGSLPRGYNRHTPVDTRKPAAATALLVPTGPPKPDKDMPLGPGSGSPSAALVIAAPTARAPVCGDLKPLIQGCSPPRGHRRLPCTMAPLQSSWARSGSRTVGAELSEQAVNTKTAVNHGDDSCSVERGAPPLSPASPQDSEHMPWGQERQPAQTPGKREMRGWGGSGPAHPHPV